MSGKDWWNRNAFSCRQKEERDGADWMSLGRVFQKVEAATENERRPTVDRRYGGTSSCCVNDDRNHISCRRAHSSKLPQKHASAEWWDGWTDGWTDGRSTVSQALLRILQLQQRQQRCAAFCIAMWPINAKSFMRHKGQPGGADLHRQTPTYTARPRKCG